MKKGYPAIGIPILDPFLVPKFDVPAIANNFVDADIMVHNVIVQNLSALEVVTGNFFKNILFFIRNYIFLNNFFYRVLHHPSAENLITLGRKHHNGTTCHMNLWQKMSVSIKTELPKPFADF